uniref:Replication protein A3 n=1 Tax=Astyanax mexicanus TaxID=7994 RepID=A0A3B1IY79_ASTMX
MTGVFESPKSRINAAMISQHVNRPVCFVGRVEKVRSERVLSDSLITLIDIRLKCLAAVNNLSLDEELSGIVEVIGMVSNKGTIMAAAYTMFREEKGISFDLELYNEALKVIQDFSQYYPFGATSG